MKERHESKNLKRLLELPLIHRIIAKESQRSNITRRHSDLDSI